MLVEFTIQNFASFREKQTLSMEAESSTHLEDYYVVRIGNLKLLKLALIYGANASGKTNVLKALGFLKDLVLKPLNNKTQELDFQPFLFDETTPTSPSIFTISFVQNQTLYIYEVHFTKKAILLEKLDFKSITSKSSKKANVFVRETDLNTQTTKIKFSRGIKIDAHSKASLESNTLWNNTVLGGFLKVNLDVKELREVLDWFQNVLITLLIKTKLYEVSSFNLEVKAIQKKLILQILQKADLNISNVIVEKKTNDSLSILLQLALDKKVILRNFDVKFEHTVNQNKYTLPLELESAGTKQFYGLAGVLAQILMSPTTLAIDELEDSLHPDLFLHFILMFLVNSKSSQIIATTHNREILGDKDLFREDVIWFTQKNKASATELYSLFDFDSSVVRNTTNILNAYKSGKLGAVPNLSDYYLDI